MEIYSRLFDYYDNNKYEEFLICHGGKYYSILKYESGKIIINSVSFKYFMGYVKVEIRGDKYNVVYNILMTKLRNDKLKQIL